MSINDLLKSPLSNLDVMRELQLVFDNLEITKNDEIIEIGTGNGIGSFMISKYVKNVTGIDISESMIELLNKNPKPINVRFQALDATKEPPEEFLNRFNKCICIDTLEHVEDPKGVLRFISQILTDGGCLVMTFPINNPHHWRNYFTKDIVYKLFKDYSEANIKIFKRNQFARLIDKFYAKVQKMLKPTKEADRFEDVICFGMIQKPKKIYYLIQLVTALLFKLSKNSFHEDQSGERALIVSKRCKNEDLYA